MVNANSQDLPETILAQLHEENQLIRVVNSAPPSSCRVEFIIGLKMRGITGPKICRQDNLP